MNRALNRDSCDGTYDQNCDPDREYTDIANVSRFGWTTTTITEILSQLLSSQGADDTLDFMNTVSQSQC
jgi:hypothetical protein